ncbi:helix-turn-helix domain-containing protein [Paenibacillus mendelii]|uniref:Helix-turn-helix domain-containing protein n=1 Tax=Paenibacillus mendelii TaxID=206163 RepID=A0ABV6JFC0_9BACL|nr:AraC family transcriptional regulator [Paenibacillus mendelii]MCQ6557488.1 AraC family transcriptional regulator [Paenibacillus mendelii]
MERWLPQAQALLLQLAHWGCGKRSAGTSWVYPANGQYVIYCIIQGEIHFKSQQVRYTLGSGEGCVIFPNQMGCFIAERQSTLCWFGVQGFELDKLLRSAGITPQTPIVSGFRSAGMKTWFRELFYHSRQQSISSDMYCYSLLYNLCSHFLLQAGKGWLQPGEEQQPTQSDYIHQALEFIHSGYGAPMTVTDMAEHVGLERSYFSKLFKEGLRQSPGRFLNEYRLDQAVRLMGRTGLPVKHIAELVGFRDPNHFAQLFRRRWGCTPRQYLMMKADRTAR